MQKKKSAVTALVVLTMNASVADEFFYIVKKGDTLSNILYAKNIKPIYGKHGSLARTLSLNPKIGMSGGNKIFPNMKIRLVDNSQIANVEVVPAELPAEVLQTMEVAPEPVTPKPTVNERVPSDDFKQSFYWMLAPSVSWKNLTSTDENAYRRSKINVSSNTNYGVGGMYGMHFEEDVDVYSRLSLESVSFIEDSSIHLVKEKMTASSFGMGILYKNKWHFEALMSDQFFLTSPNLTSVDIKKVTLPELKSSYLKDFYQYRSAKLSYSLSGSAFLPRNAGTVDSKLGYGGGTGVEAKLRNQSFKIGYDLNMLKSNGNSTNYHNIYWKYTWEAL